jgi:putative DNA primase/helicase
LSLLPDGLSDREQDNWIYLLMIAQLAGDEWLEKAKEAALAMHANVEPSVSIGVELLSDIREIFALERQHKISTVDLITKLIEDAESPWSAWYRDKPISPRQLAKLLDSYGIKSKNLKFNGQTLKGFEVAQFEDAFKRYLEPEILPQLRNDTPEALIYKPSAVADETQPKSTVAQRYDDLFEDIF